MADGNVISFAAIQQISLTGKTMQLIKNTATDLLQNINKLKVVADVTHDNLVASHNIIFYADFFLIKSWNNYPRQPRFWQMCSVFNPPT